MKCNIRVLGGLVSGHLLATDSTDRLGEGGFVCKKDIRLPINAKFRGPYGVMENETTETSTSGFSNSGNGSIIPIDWRPEIRVEFTWYKHWMYQLGNGLNIQLGLGLEYFRRGPRYSTIP
ncbi:Glycosyl hydrolase family 47 protein [Prunus dulcis]|uniref:Glycosyl hydrolase family 47 protein n=1 Tax=Prunus dulcis TaxID=3755 RepID=A0A4Y1RFC1_PRUDU|nr:Glycosyl hydrolase family 47 protein [Prunus dulcis]